MVLVSPGECGPKVQFASLEVECGQALDADAVNPGNITPGEIFAEAELSEGLQPPIVADRVRCSESGNGGHGIYVRESADGMVIQSCTVKNNGGEGIQVEGDLNWLEKNKAKKGDGLIDLGDNNSGRGNTVNSGATNDF